jgi:hypothetical protein
MSQYASLRETEWKNLLWAGDNNMKRIQPLSFVGGLSGSDELWEQRALYTSEGRRVGAVGGIWEYWRIPLKV